MVIGVVPVLYAALHRKNLYDSGYISIPGLIVAPFKNNIWFAIGLAT